MVDGPDGAPTETFEDFIYIDKFDGLLSLFTLLHLTRVDLPSKQLIEINALESEDESAFKAKARERFKLENVDDIDLKNKDLLLYEFNEYMKSAIDSCTDTYFREFEHYISKHMVIESEKLFRYCEIMMDRLNTLLIDLEDSTHLHGYKPIIRTKINLCIQKIKDEYLPKSFLNPEENKIKFNLSKKEVCLLFTKLANAGIIAIEQSSEKLLGELIETHCTFHEPRSNSFKSITKAYKTIQKNRQDPRHQTESETLNRIFK